MKVLYLCKADPQAAGGVSEVARRHRATVEPTISVIAPDLTEGEVLRHLLKDGAEFDLVHLWAGQFPFVTAFCRADLNLPVVLDRSSTHIRWQRNVLREEFQMLTQQGILDPRWEPPYPSEEACLKQTIEYRFAHVVVPEAHAQSTFEGSFTRSLSVVPTGVDAARFAVPNRVPDTRQLRVLFSGHNWFRKGMLYLWMAARSLEDRRRFEFRYDFNLGTTTPPPFRLPRLVSTDYSFTNYPSGLDDVYPLIDVAVLPTLEDSLPLSVDEAMAASIPVITTPNAGSRVVDGKSGFIVPIRDWKSIATHLEYFRDNPGEVVRMGKEARAVAERTTWNAYAESLRKVYETAIGGV